MKQPRYILHYVEERKEWPYITEWKEFACESMKEAKEFLSIMDKRERAYVIDKANGKRIDL